MEKEPASYTSPNNQDVDFVLVTILDEERDAVLKKLPGFHKSPPAKDDIHTCYQAELPVTFPDGSVGVYRVVVMSMLGMGRVPAAVATKDAIRRWQPRYIVLVGIAGGVAAKTVAIGDILISDQIVDYELQKLTPEGPEMRWEVHRADPQLLNACYNFSSSNWHNRKAVGVNRPRRGKPKRHTGPIASGDKVIAFGEVLAKYQDVWSRLIGVEMEAAGVATAVFQSTEKPGFFMVRGVSDLADEDKGSPDVAQWRSYACAVAASFTIELLQSGPVPLSEEWRTPVEVASPPNAEKAARGLDALNELMEEPQIRKAIYEFRFDFRETSERFQTLNNDKLIHDALHDLQFLCYEPIVKDRRFPWDESSVANLMKYEAWLEDTKSDAARDRVWIRKLEEALELLKKAIESEEPKDLDGVIDRLKQVLDIWPSTINTRLNTVTRMIDLPGLGRALIAVGEKLNDPTLDQEKVGQFKTGIASLLNLSRQLETVVFRHDHWQQIDNELRRIDSIMTVQDTSELEGSWADIKSLTVSLQTDTTDSAMKSFAEAQAALDRAIEQKDTSGIIRYFDSYHARATARFRKADQDLKRLCDELLKVGQPLAAIMQIMGEG
jgi:nucleoside phosphorylase